MIRTGAWLIAMLVPTAALSACGGGDHDAPVTPTAILSPEASGTTPEAGGPFLVYRDAAGDLVAQQMGGTQQYRLMVDFTKEVIVGTACSPDGSRIAYLRQSFEETERQVLIRGDDAPDEPLFIPATAQGVGWSPDATRLVIADYDGFKQMHEISILDVTTEELTKIESGEDYVGSIAWSPDGKQLAFYKQDIATGDTQLYLLSPDGGEARQLTEGAVKPYDPEWSADGNALLVSGLVEQDFQLYRVGAATGEFTQLTDSDIYKRGPKYSPDGATIGYTGSIVTPQVSLRPLRGLHSFGIFLLNSDGTDERAFTADPRLNPGAAVDPYLDAYLLGWCTPGPWLDDLWGAEEVVPIQ